MLSPTTIAQGILGRGQALCKMVLLSLANIVEILPILAHSIVSGSHALLAQAMNMGSGGYE